MSDLPPTRAANDRPGGLPVASEPVEGRTAIAASSAEAVGAAGPDLAYPPADPRTPRESAPLRSLVVQAVADTFSRFSTRVSLAWLLTLTLLAVFAPLLATSYPLIWRLEGSWELPVLRSLRWIDVTLLVLFFSAVGGVILARASALPGSVILAGVLGLTGATAAVAAVAIAVPEVTVYDRFRQAQLEGRADRVLRAPVAYSANDRSNDTSDSLLLPPFWAAGPGRDAERVAENRRTDASGGRHWLGTNIFNEDVASRMIHATRIALAVGFIATGIAVVIGVFVGGVMGYFAGWVDLIGMRILEIVESIPRLVLLLIVMVSIDRNIYLIMTVIGLISWTSEARFIRAEFLKLRKQDFVQAATAAGLPLGSILFRHMLPNGVAPVLVNVSFGIGQAILLESTLSFLGLGLRPEEASWGQLLDQARRGGAGFSWWMAIFPGLAIFLTVFAFILIGEALRDAIDPKLKKADRL